MEKDKLMYKLGDIVTFEDNNHILKIAKVIGVPSKMYSTYRLEMVVRFAMTPDRIKALVQPKDEDIQVDDYDTNI